MKKIVLFGAGGFGREVAYLIERINMFQKPTYELLGFLVEKKFLKSGMKVNGYPVLGDEQWLYEHPDVVCTCTIADVDAKARIQTTLMEKGVIFETIIAPGVRIAPKYTTIGVGCVIYSDVGISVNVNIGDGVLLNAGVAIGHETNIGKYTSIMPGTRISGRCQIGEQVSIGGHSFIVPRKKIGDHAVVAAGSVVFSNVKSRTTVLGNPAKRMRMLEE